jgi:membrane protease YdiL (CAAX protease family)
MWRRAGRDMKFVRTQGLTIVPLAVLFEGALGLAGAGLAWWLDTPLARKLDVSTGAVWRSAVGLIPLLLLLAFATRSRWRPFAELRRQVEQLVGNLFRDVPWTGLAAVSLAAGVGEEILFRGALQPLAERWLGPAAGLVAISMLFGALHAATRTYFVLATLVGFYLGWLAQHYDDLVAPITIHAAYDFVALLVLRRTATAKINAFHGPKAPDLAAADAPPRR